MGLGFEEGDCGVVVRGGVGRVDAEVTLEARDGSVFFLFLLVTWGWGCGCGCGLEERGEEY